MLVCQSAAEYGFLTNLSVAVLSALLCDNHSWQCDQGNTLSLITISLTKDVELLLKKSMNSFWYNYWLTSQVSQLHSRHILQVLESCMKNCGSLIHDEVATKEFMEFLKGLVNVGTHKFFFFNNLLCVKYVLHSWYNVF